MTGAALDWDLEEVAAAVGGSLVGRATTRVTAVGIDSRTITAGSLFVAVAGPTYDGHDFAASALAKGAVGALVERGRCSQLIPRIEVTDGKAALRDLAVAHRRTITAPVVAISGSTGKTSTKDLAAAALPDAWASPRSFNNEIGVPLTVLATPPGARHVVVEVGSRGRGQIEWLMPAITPDVAVVTNLGVVHLETFGSIEAIREAKWELVAGLAAGGTAVLPADEPRLLQPHLGRTVTFGTGIDAEVAAVDTVLDELGRPEFTVVTDAGKARLRLQLSGRHQAVNAAAAVAAGLALGHDLERLVDGMRAATGARWRMDVHAGPVTVVNDAYNANPDSVEAALRTVAEFPGRHIAVLGLMAELGDVAEAEHLRIGRLVDQLGFVAAIVVGEDLGIARGAGPIARSVPGEEEAISMLDSFLKDGDVVLVKASREIGLETLALRLVARWAA